MLAFYPVAAVVTLIAGCGALWGILWRLRTALWLYLDVVSQIAVTILVTLARRGRHDCIRLAAFLHDLLI